MVCVLCTSSSCFSTLSSGSFDHDTELIVSHDVIIENILKQKTAAMLNYNEMVASMANMVLKT